MRIPNSRHTTCVSLLLLVCVSGCQSFQEATGLLERQSGTAGVSSFELRPMVDDLVLHYASSVELAADQIIAQTDDPQVHKHALLWKSNGIAACFQAATRRDPLAAFVNIWILNKQTLNLFQRVDSPPLFGDQQSIAIDTSLELEQSFDQILERIGRDFPIGEEFATRFAADFPISNLYFDRASIAQHYTQYIEKITVDGKDLQQVVSGLETQIDQFQKLSALYAEFLPKQARWQAELLVLETSEGDVMRTVLNEVTSATDSLQRVTEVVESFPNLVAQERDILRTTVAEERIATLQSLEHLQAATMSQLEKERVAVLQELSKERATILDELKQERIAVTTDATNFGQQIVDQIDASADTKIDTITQRGVMITDHFFKRAAQLGSVLLITLLLLFCWTRRSRTDGPDRSRERLTDSDVESIRPADDCKPAHPGILKHRRAA